MVTLTCALDFEHMTDLELLEVTPETLRADSREDAAAKHLEQLAIRRDADGFDLVDAYIARHCGH